MKVLGVDPGASGALAWLDTDTGTGRWERMPSVPKMGLLLGTLVELVEADRPELAVLEQAQSFPGMGVTGSFSYGRGFGQLEGVLAALRIPYVLVRPDRWHRELVGKTKRPEGQTKEEARRLAKLRALAHVQRTLPSFALPSGKGDREAVVEALCCALWAMRHREAA